MKVITRNDAKQMILGSAGKIFTVTFTKKDGSDRVMTARTEVAKHTVGGTNHVAAKNDHLLPVFDMSLARQEETKGRKAYRMINVNTLKSLKINNTEYEVK